MVLRKFGGWCRLLVTLLACAAGDATPPVLDIVHVQEFLFHFLVTVQLNEDGHVYCGTLLRSGGPTYVPSPYQMETGSGLDAHGDAAVTASTFTQIVVASMAPSTMYDLYCYATDTYMNGINIADHVRRKVVTASGGDYIPPTFAYVRPFDVVDSTEVRVFVSLSEDGNVWCVALEDFGYGTSVPSSQQIVNNVGVASWGTVAIVAQRNYKDYIRLQGLTEDTTYDVYCFGVDMSGNGIDRTPAYVTDTTAIPNTRKTLTTLPTLVPSMFQLHTPSGGPVYYQAEPAAWNVQLPRSWSSGCATLRSIESYSTPVRLERAHLVSHDADDNTTDTAHGCGALPPAPRAGGPHVALLRRGKCNFGRKTSMAQKAGYKGVVVIDYQLDAYAPILPSMSTFNDASHLDIPAWLISAADGEGLLDVISSTSPGMLTAILEDRYRKPVIGNRQRDQFGLRSYATQ